jgi:hypothetical protein
VTKKRKSILVWIFTWAGLLVALLYSPVGSPDLYKSSTYFVGNQNTNLNGSNIENSPDINFDSGNDYSELNLPEGDSENSAKLSSGNYNYAITASNDHDISSAASYSASQSQSYQNLKNGSSGSMGAGGSFISGNGGNGGASSSAIAMNNGGITTLSADLTAISTKRGVSYAGNQGGTDPGGDPDQKTRIPVSDGWLFLLVLATSYGFIKKKFFTA